MNKTILDVPDEILYEIFSRYLSVKDLGRLEQVCRRFHHVFIDYPSIWKNALSNMTNVLESQLKNAAGCPVLQNIRYPSTRISHSLIIPSDYQYEILSNNSDEYSLVSGNDVRRKNTCSKLDCDRTRLHNNSRYLLYLAYQWKTNNYSNHQLIKFNRRAQTSLIQYDEHQHQLWFTYDHTLSCLDLDQKQIISSYSFIDDDVLCYKIYDDHLIGMSNGNTLRILCRETDEVYRCDEQDDVMSLDMFSNDRNRYLILNGTRDHTVSMRIFDMSMRTNELLWRTKVDDRVLCSRFTCNGEYCLIGTGGTSSPYPLVLFNTEKAQPIHLYNCNYRVGAGVRCIEWVCPNVFIAAGFDNQFKEFDLRTGHCHFTYNDEFANDYCSLAVSADYNNVANGIVLGGNHHSTVRLFNRKQRQTENVYFVSKQASPVHSLAVTSEYLFASVDRSIVVLDFTRNHQHFRQIKYGFN